MNNFKNILAGLVLAFAFAGGGFNALKPDGDEGPEVVQVEEVQSPENKPLKAEEKKTPLVLASLKKPVLFYKKVLLRVAAVSAVVGGTVFGVWAWRKGWIKNPFSRSSSSGDDGGSGPDHGGSGLSGFDALDLDSMPEGKAGKPVMVGFLPMYEKEGTVYVLLKETDLNGDAVETRRYTGFEAARGVGKKIYGCQAQEFRGREDEVLAAAQSFVGKKVPGATIPVLKNKKGQDVAMYAQGWGVRLFPVAVAHDKPIPGYRAVALHDLIESAEGIIAAAERKGIERVGFGRNGLNLKNDRNLLNCVSGDTARVLDARFAGVVARSGGKGIARLRVFGAQMLSGKIKPGVAAGPVVASSSSGDDDAGDEAEACCVCLTASPDRMYKCNGKFAIKDDADDEKGHALCSGCFGTMMASTKKCPTCRGDMSER